MYFAKANTLVFNIRVSTIHNTGSFRLLHLNYYLKSKLTSIHESKCTDPAKSVILLFSENVHLQFCHGFLMHCPGSACPAALAPTNPDNVVNQSTALPRVIHFKPIIQPPCLS